MKKTILILVALSFLSVSTFAQDNWNDFSSETGKFSVDFSGNIKESSVEKEKSSSFKIAITKGEMSYMISSTKHQTDLSNEIDKLLNVSISSFKESVDATFISQQDVTRNDASGIYVDMIFSEGTVRLEYFVFIKGMYQYQVMAYSLIESYNEDEANQFFRSFTILE